MTKVKRQNKFKINIKNPAIRWGIFVILSLLFISIVNVDGHAVIKYANESEFHFSRILSLSNIFQSPVNFNYFNHSGQMINTFVPWLTIYPMYLLIMLCHSTILGYYIYFILLTIITLEISYQCSIRITQKAMPSFIFSIFYSFASYRILDIYYRKAFSEAIALTFLPFILLGLYQVFFDKKGKYSGLVIGFVGLLYTDYKTTVIAIIFVVSAVILTVIMNKVTKGQLFNFVKACGLTLILGLGSLVPLWQVLLTTQIANGNEKLADNALSLQDFLLNALNNNFRSIEENHFIKVLPSIGLILFIVMIVVICNYRKLNKFEQVVFWTTGVSLFLSTKLFPWGFFQKFIGIIERPWIFLGLASLGIAYLGAVVIAQLNMKWSLSLFTIVATIVLLMVTWANYQNLFRDDAESVITDKTYATLDKQFYGEDYERYVPKDYQDNLTDVVNGVCYQNYEKIPSERTESDNGTVQTYVIVSDTKSEVSLPVLTYPGLTVKHNGQKTKYLQNGTGFIQVKCKEGKNIYQIQYHYTLLAKISACISFVALLLSIGWNIFCIKRRKEAK